MPEQVWGEWWLPGGEDDAVRGVLAIPAEPTARPTLRLWDQLAQFPTGEVGAIIDRRTVIHGSNGTDAFTLLGCSLRSRAELGPPPAMEFSCSEVINDVIEGPLDVRWGKAFAGYRNLRPWLWQPDDRQLLSEPWSVRSETVDTPVGELAWDMRSFPGGGTLFEDRGVHLAPRVVVTPTEPRTIHELEDQVLSPLGDLLFLLTGEPAPRTELVLADESDDGYSEYTLKRFGYSDDPSLPDVETHEVLVPHRDLTNDELGEACSRWFTAGEALWSVAQHIRAAARPGTYGESALIVLFSAGERWYRVKTNQPGKSHSTQNWLTHIREAAGEVADEVLREGFNAQAEQTRHHLIHGQPPGPQVAVDADRIALQYEMRLLLTEQILLHIGFSPELLAAGLSEWKLTRFLKSRGSPTL